MTKVVQILLVVRILALFKMAVELQVIVLDDFYGDCDGVMQNSDVLGKVSKDSVCSYFKL